MPVIFQRQITLRAFFKVKSPAHRLRFHSCQRRALRFPTKRLSPPQYLLTWVLIVQELACCVWKRDKVFNPQNPETLSSSKSLPVGICLRANISWQRFLPLGTSIGTFCQYELIGTWCKNVETLLKAASERVTRCWAVPLMGRWSLGDAALADGISTKSWRNQHTGVGC